MRIAIDTMGGDFGPRATLRGTASALLRDSRLCATLVGPKHLLDAELDSLPASLSHARERLQTLAVDGIVASDARPSRVLRGREPSSMSEALRLVASGHADACVSGGNTGALMALAMREVGRVVGVERPAICAAVPTRGARPCHLLDLGANVEVAPRHLLAFARMGALRCRLLEGVERPRVGLLNVGVESGKGTTQVREADALLASAGEDFDYLGFVEGGELFSGTLDVVVCDGFVGNIVLKSSEGLAQMLAAQLGDTLAASWRARLMAWLARPALARLTREMDPVRYNGASLLGLAGVVVKSHGGATGDGFSFAVTRAAHEAHQQLPVYLAAGMTHASDIEGAVESPKKELDK
ncbi:MULTISPECIES: phosphate acyltransferase PlsX [Cobetia]|uniref:Phosphate acyltransferase n=1 Tax=Cobetia crustatorum TaxID=553385 RepID=A0A558HXC2_9GAMM|nr:MULTISPECIES: phosphate acyltransferase PlsX [Cobetia]TVU73757.1 phosphate acyltransferase PlsX [Cobetia crustatorum]